MLALSRSSKTGYRGVYANPTNVSRPFTASVKPRGERRKSLGSYATAVEAALAAAKYDAENPQPAQPASGGGRGAKQKQKRRKRSEDGFDRITTADVIRMEEEEGYVSEESDEESNEEYSALIPLLQRQVLCVDTTASTPSTLR